jgi:hypothetical protein
MCGPKAPTGNIKQPGKLFRVLDNIANGSKRRVQLYSVLSILVGKHECSILPFRKYLCCVIRADRLNEPKTAPALHFRKLVDSAFIGL